MNWRHERVRSLVRQWRDRMGWSQRRAAKELGKSLRGLQRLERGNGPDDPRPQYLKRTDALAMQALVHGLGPWAPDADADAEKLDGAPGDE